MLVSIGNDLGSARSLASDQDGWSGSRGKTTYNDMLAVEESKDNDDRQVFYNLLQRNA